MLFPSQFFIYNYTKVLVSLSSLPQLNPNLQWNLKLIAKKLKVNLGNSKNKKTCFTYKEIRAFTVW